MSRRRAYRPRYPALPYVQEHMAFDHARLTAAGYTLDHFLHVRFDLRRGFVRFGAVWRKPAPEIGPDARRIFSSYQTVDTFTHAPVP